MLNKVPPSLHDQTVTAANTAFTGGLQAALGCAAILLLIGAVLTLIGVRGRGAPMAPAMPTGADSASAG